MTQTARLDSYGSRPRPPLSFIPILLTTMQISYLSSSQGFTWNPGMRPQARQTITMMLTQLIEIFLPSYVDCEYTPLENRREPVHEILLSDEESRSMLPQ